MRDGKSNATSALVWWSAVALRVLLITVSEVNDARSDLKYTDVDYLVYTDAAREVASGRSPYDRATFRYTPLLAWLLLPGVAFHAWGKLVFCALDLAAAWFAYRILRHRGVSSRASSLCVAAYLLHPFVINVSTRGNGDSAVCALVLAVLWCLLARRETAAAALFGLAVHVKIYPVVYAPALLLFLDDEHYGGGIGACGRRGAPRRAARRGCAGTYDAVRRLVSLRRVRFAATASAAFVAVTAAAYAAYGAPMLSEAFVYHATRADARHSFSAAFYDAYLHPPPSLRPPSWTEWGAGRVAGGSGGGDACVHAVPAGIAAGGDPVEAVEGAASGRAARIQPCHRGRPADGRDAALEPETALDGCCGGERPAPAGAAEGVAVRSQGAAASAAAWAVAVAGALPQWGLVLFLGAWFARDLPAALFFVTWAFVGWNRVVTAQYFNWYNCLLPLLLPQSHLRAPHAAALAVTWLATELLWNLSAYHLELRGQAVFGYVWAMGLAFQCANALVLAALVGHHGFRPVFVRGTLAPLPRASWGWLDDASARLAAALERLCDPSRYLTTLRVHARTAGARTWWAP